MSELKVNKVTPRSGTTVTLGDSGDSVAIPTGVGFNGFGFRNILINGDMSIAQRGTSQATAGSAVGDYQVQDRWKFYNNNQGAFTWSQNTDVPSGQGFATSMKFDCTTADASPAASDYLILEQSFEGQNLQYLKKGTANAQSLTLSFWVKSVKTGTYIAGLFDSDNTRQISKSYTINSASTWEYKSVTFAGDTTGTLDNDNGKSLVALFFLGGGTDITSGTLATSWESYTAANRAVGQVNLADDTANEWYITGVQLEAGTTASDFEFLPIDVNLGRCQRYYYKVSPQAVGEVYGSGFCVNTTLFRNVTQFAVPMRAAPSALEQSGTAADYTVLVSGGTVACSAVPTFNVAGLTVSTVNLTVASGLTAGTGGIGKAANTSAYLAWSAEL